MGSKVLKIAKQNGVLGGTIFLGKGTVKNRLLQILDLCDIKKEIVVMITDQKTAQIALEDLANHLHLQKPNHGIAFSTSVTNFIGAVNCEYQEIPKNRGSEKSMYDAIFVVVDKGRAELVMDAATSSGARGGTIINARGSGINETSKLFSMEIEPEKELVLILSAHHLTEAIVAAVREKLEIDKPGKGIIFVQNVDQAYGIV